MLFKTANERIASGSTAYLELQYCTAKSETPMEKIFRQHFFWKTDSLYVYADDFEAFWNRYAVILKHGAHHPDGSAGEVDMCGINYYTPQETTDIVRKMKTEYPQEDATFFEWLYYAEKHTNGFYLLGI